MTTKNIRIFGAAEHNLKNIDVEIPRNSLTIITGLSGSGKSSLAFDTLYAEGQRRYVESLSAYARQFLEQMPKPHVEHIEGLSPAIAIEQKSVSKNPRSTVATVTELYDYLRLLFANLGTPHWPRGGKPIARQTVQQIVDQVLALPRGSRLMILAPVVRGRKGQYSDLLKKAAGIIKGSSTPNKEKVGKVTAAQIKEIAQKKLPDLNAYSVEKAEQIIKGTARSMGLEIIE